MQMYSVRTIAATPIPIEQFYVQQDSPLNQQQVMLLNKRVRYYVNVGSVVQAEGCFYLVALTQVDFASHIQRRLGIDSYFKSILCDAFNCSYDFRSLLLSNFSLLRCAGSQLANIPRFLSSSKFRIVRFVIAYLIALITFYLLYRFYVYYALQLRAASVRLGSRSLLLTTLQVTSILVRDLRSLLTLLVRGIVSPQTSFKPYCERDQGFAYNQHLVVRNDVSAERRLKLCEEVAVTLLLYIFRHLVLKSRQLRGKGLDYLVVTLTSTLVAQGHSQRAVNQILN